MESTFALFAGVSALVAVAAAVISVIQAKHAGTQARAAEEQVRLQREQLDLYKREREVRLVASLRNDDKKKRPVILIENRSDRRVNIQEVVAIAKDGRVYRKGDCNGECIDRNGKCGALPAILESGTRMTFTICDYVAYKNPPGATMIITGLVADSPEYSTEFWQSLDRFEVRADNDKVFVVDEAGHEWRQLVGIPV